MQLSPKILGKHATDVLTARVKTPLLQIGSYTFYRGDFAAIGCFSFLAAINLGAALQALQPRNTKDVYDNIPPSSLVLPRVGSISLAVLGAAFEARGIGGDQPLESWVVRHRPKEAGRLLRAGPRLRAPAFG